MKIFIIGFNKTTTTSIDAFFRSSGLPTIHWKNNRLYLAKQIAENIRLSKPILFEMDEYSVYSDFTYVTSNEVIEGNQFFRELHTAYPNGTFILNTRDIDDWLLSRLRHSGFVERYSKALNLSISETVNHWVELKQNREMEIRDFFHHSPQFIDFDLTKNNLKDLAEIMGGQVQQYADTSLFLNRT